MTKYELLTGAGRLPPEIVEYLTGGTTEAPATAQPGVSSGPGGGNDPAVWSKGPSMLPTSRLGAISAGAAKGAPVTGPGQDFQAAANLLGRGYSPGNLRTDDTIRSNPQQEAMIEAIFQQYLGRSPQFSGVQNTLHAMDVYGMTPEQAAMNVAGSSEAMGRMINQQKGAGMRRPPQFAAFSGLNGGL